MVDFHLLHPLLRGQEEVTVGLVVDIRKILAVNVELSICVPKKISSEHGHFNIFGHGELLSHSSHGERGSTALILRETTKKSGYEVEIVFK